MCDFETSISEDNYGDHICPNCGVMISVYDLNAPKLGNENKPSTSYDDYIKNRETQPKEGDMANLGDLRKNLRKEDVQTGDVIKFIDAGEIKDVDFSPAQDGSKVETVFQATVELPNGKQKIYTPNATTRGILGDKWGEDTEAWVGKEATAKFIDQLSFGKLTKVLILEPID
jgi:hypothetical protein